MDRYGTSDVLPRWRVPPRKLLIRDIRRPSYHLGPDDPAGLPSGPCALFCFGAGGLNLESCAPQPRGCAPLRSHSVTLGSRRVLMGGGRGGYRRTILSDDGTLGPVPKRVFVSSTIADFIDMRSALHYWLGERGCEVLASEISAFKTSGAESAIEACLNNVRRADYVVVLVGDRGGGWADEGQGVTVTLAEYRAAREAQRTRPVGISVFVREGVWNAWRAKGKKSKTSAKWRGVFKLLDEVAGMPDGAFVRPFDRFEQVAQWLTTNMGLPEQLPLLALRTNLRLELERNLSSILLMDGAGRAQQPISQARYSYRGAADESSRYTVEALKQLRFTYLFLMPWGANIQMRALEAALDAGLFLELDHGTGSYRTSLGNRALQDLRDATERYRWAQEHRKGETIAIVDAFKGMAGLEVELGNETMILVFALFDALENIINLSGGLWHALRGDLSKLKAVSLNGRSPSERTNMENQKLRPSGEEVVEWLTSFSATAPASGAKQRRSGS